MGTGTRVLMGGVAATLVSMTMAAGANAAVIEVSSTADPAGAATDCTLRQALDSANSGSSPSGSDCTAGSGADTITFDPAILPATIIAPGLGISSDVTIQGPGDDELAVTGNDGGRVFQVFSGTSTISGLSIEDGFVEKPSAGPDGGAGVAIDFGATLTIDDATVIGNVLNSTVNGGTIPIARAYGAGIYNNGGTLTVRDTWVANNSMVAFAANGDDLTIALAAGSGLMSTNGTLVVERSTFSGNTAEANLSATSDTATETRGAIAVYSNALDGPDAQISNTTIVDNSLVNSGGAFNVTQTGGGLWSNAPMDLTSSTVTGNSAATGDNLATDVDGEISMRNTIVAAPAQGANCSGVTSAGYNFSSDATCDSTQTGDIENGGDPNLKPLASYGGPTQTRPPDVPTLVNQGVIDLGINSSPALATDQRGLDRTVGFDVPNGPSGDGTDIGAVEIQGAKPTSSDPASPGDEPDPLIVGTTEPGGGGNVSVFGTADCTGTAATDTPNEFTNEGIRAETDYDRNTVNSLTASSMYGTATSECSDPIAYLRIPDDPDLESTNPPSGANNNTPRLIGYAQSGTTVSVYSQAGCTGPVAGTGTAAEFDGTGIQVTVADNSTTTFSVQSTGVGGVSPCSDPLDYTEVTPPPTPVTPVTPTPVTPTPTPAAPKKCKKGQKLKKGKCVKKKKTKKR